MSKTKLWKWYFNLFIRTPIAALLLIVALAVGLTLLTSSITVRVYASVQAEVYDWTDKVMAFTMFSAKLDHTPSSTGLHVGDAVVWYVESSGERYDGEIITIEANGTGSRVNIRTDAVQWKLAMKEVDTDITSVTVDLPIGRQSVREKLFGSKGGDAQ